MDLKEFVAGTLTQIIEGVKEAQKAAKTHGAEVSPKFQQYQSTINSFSFNKKDEVIRFVKFDVALSATEGSERGTSGGLKVIVAAVGGKSLDVKETSTVSRLQFEIPVVWPVQQQKEYFLVTVL